MRRLARRPPIEVWMIVKSGDKLRRRRRSEGLTQADLAAAARCTQQYISALETGIDIDCSDTIAKLICRFLRIDNPEDYFTERTSSRVPSVTTSSRASRLSA